MKVLLIHVDGKMPNLALMKLSAHHKQLGDDIALVRMHGANVELFPFEPEYIYASCIFPNNSGFARGITKYAKQCQGVQIGGCGIEGDYTLPYFIEHMMPDYALYDIDYSMGFTSRGCFRHCPWCIVPKHEGNIRDHAPISEFLYPTHQKLVLLDNNFLASPKCEKNLQFLVNQQVKVNFNQGLDVRLLTEDTAQLLANTWYYDWKFKNRRLHFAFDTPSIEDDVIKGIELLENCGIRRRHLMFYVLIGFDTLYHEDLERVRTLLDQDVSPYVMTYNNRRDSYYHHFERWINGLYYQQGIAWQDYDNGNSQQIIKSLAMKEL